jgi:hypothetical protein
VNPSLEIFRSHEVLDELDPDILVPFDGTAQVYSTKSFTDRIPVVEIPETSDVII